jgi:hypothetical protein
MPFEDPRDITNGLLSCRVITTARRAKYAFFVSTAVPDTILAAYAFTHDWDDFPFKILYGASTVVGFGLSRVAEENYFHLNLLSQDMRQAFRQVAFELSTAGKLTSLGIGAIAAFAWQPATADVKGLLAMGGIGLFGTLCTWFSHKRMDALFPPQP